MKKGLELSLNTTPYPSLHIDDPSAEMIFNNEDNREVSSGSSMIAWRHIKSSLTGISQPWYIRLQEHRNPS
ncbi:hypothetical protein J2Z69_003555 [Paenibacillus shirakamiensis]|uniref:Uncharacterized protein n=1 Tax=Paenibacillus shirakamiensis TaxID=1265935 RepID=A0ABS4JL83_9BACL|nr:hypothetical protein [Paenibacillus shirakamiensis]